MKRLIEILVVAGSLLIAITAQAQVLLASTNQGELVEVDLMAGTATLIGDAGMLPGKAADMGWTGLSFDVAGNLIVSSRQFVEPETGCPGSPANAGVLQCSHLYQIDPMSGAVIAEVGNTEMPYVSDIDFSFGTNLFGNQWDGRGALASINSTMGTGSIVSHFGEKMNRMGAAVSLQNGGISVHPYTGEIWAIESNFAFIEDADAMLFRVDPVTGIVMEPIIPIGLGGAPVEFGFDGLEILPDGRFIATRGGPRNEIYEINPKPDATTGLAEITQIPLMIDAMIVGSLNGLEFYQTSPGLIESLITDIRELGLDGRTTRRMERVLVDASKKLDRGKLGFARYRICEFIDLLEAAVAGSRVGPNEASILLKKASKILGEIGFQ